MKQLFELFQAAGYELFLVGRAVRELLAGRAAAELDDLDFATSAPAIVVEKLLHGAGLGTYQTGWNQGTIGTYLKRDGRDDLPQHVQITPYRSQEIYLPGARRPEVRGGAPLEEDLARRALSINCLAQDAQGQIIDPFGGRADLEARRLRLVGDPEQSLREDPLRLLRLARHIAQLGFKPTERVRRATEHAAASILDVSRDRWLQEMDKLLLGPHVAQALVYLQQTRLLGFILPEVAATVGFDQTSEFHHKDVWHHTILVVAQSAPRQAVRWAALLHDIGKVWTREYQPNGKVHFFRHEDMGAMLVEGIAVRFHFPGPLRQAVRFLVKHHLRANLYDGSWTDSAVRRFNTETAEMLPDLLDLSRADVTSANPTRKQRALALVEELASRSAAIREQDDQLPLLPKGLGRAIMERFGLPPGRRIGELRELLEEALLQGTLAAGTEVPVLLEHLASLGLPDLAPVNPVADATSNGCPPGSPAGPAAPARPASNPDVADGPRAASAGEERS